MTELQMTAMRRIQALWNSSARVREVRTAIARDVARMTPLRIEVAEPTMRSHWHAQTSQLPTEEEERKIA